MEITKEFAPITIKINTEQELKELKQMCSKAVHKDEYDFYIFHCKRGQPSWMELARKILDL